MTQSGVVRARVAASLAVVLLLLVVTACGGGDDSPTLGSDGPAPSKAATPSDGPAASNTPTAAGTILSVTVRGGSVEGASRQRATLNQPVTIRVTSDVADEVHVHGYDKHVDVTPGRTGELTFMANIPGVFEVELERSQKLLFTMEVR